MKIPFSKDQAQFIQSVSDVDPFSDLSDDMLLKLIDDLQNHLQTFGSMLRATEKTKPEQNVQIFLHGSPETPKPPFGGFLNTLERPRTQHGARLLHTKNWAGTP